MNRLTQLPEEIGQLVKLETLVICGNLLNALPKSLSKLKNLREFDASRNQISTFPVALSSLNNLDSVDLSSNKIKSIPDGVEELQLTILSLNQVRLKIKRNIFHFCNSKFKFQNQISAISTALSKCPRLKTLKLEENCLSLDAIPKDLLEHSSVSTINLNGNLFSEKQFADCEGYDKYLERYTAVRRKMD